MSNIDKLIEMLIKISDSIVFYSQYRGQLKIAAYQLGQMQQRIYTLEKENESLEEEIEELQKIIEDNCI